MKTLFREMLESRGARVAAQIAGWAWAALAGGGGLWLLWTRGPWPPTNGWFALFSGLAAWPLTATTLRALAGIKVSGLAQLGGAAFSSLRATSLSPFLMFNAR